MSEYEKDMEVFKEYLKKNNLKVTSQRLLVAQKIFEIHHHFSAESLMDEFIEKRNEISKATIYRILLNIILGMDLNIMNISLDMCIMTILFVWIAVELKNF